MKFFSNFWGYFNNSFYTRTWKFPWLASTYSTISKLFGKLVKAFLKLPLFRKASWQVSTNPLENFERKITFFIWQPLNKRLLCQIDANTPEKIRFRKHSLFLHPKFNFISPAWNASFPIRCSTATNPPRGPTIITA